MQNRAEKAWSRERLKIYRLAASGSLCEVYADRQISKLGRRKQPLIRLVIACVALTCQAKVANAVEQTKKPTAVRVEYTPPKNAIVANPVDLIGADDDASLIPLGTMEQRKECVAVIPLKNSSSKTLAIKHIGVSCGCMSPIVTSLVIKPGNSVKVYFRVTPEDPGSFAKIATIFFKDSPRFVLKFTGKCKPRFQIRPPRALVTRNGKSSSPITVVPNFGDKLFRVSSLNPDVTLEKQDTVEADEPATFRGVFRQDRIDELPFDVTVPVLIETATQKFSYVLNVVNGAAIKFSPSAPIAVRNGKGGLHLIILATSFQLDKGIPKVALSEQLDGVELEVTQAKRLGEITAVYKLALSGNTESLKSFALKWTVPDENEPILLEVSVREQTF